MIDALGAPQSVLVLGGSSEIGTAIARRLARPRRARVVLAGRSLQQLEDAAVALRAQGAGDVLTESFDARDTASHPALVADLFERHGGFDVVIFAFGVLGDQQATEADSALAVEIAETNYVGAVSAGLEVSRRLQDQGHGVLVVLSSVAGERARRSNFVYGSSKAGLDAFAQGLAAAMAPSGVRVLVVRPGFVRSRMTAGLKAAPLSTTPDAVAEVVEGAIRSSRARVVWAPPQLRLVMIVLRHLPEVVFRRLPL